MDPEMKQIVADVHDTVLAIKADKNKHDREINDLKSRIDALAFNKPTPTDEGATRAFPFPSLREYRNLGGDEQKSQRISSDPDGGNVVFPEAGPFHDRMRATNVVLAAGPQIVDMTTLELLLPGLSASTTAYPTAEQGTLTESDATFQQVRLAARKYTVRTVASSELLADSNPAARQIIADDHARQLANKLDLDMLEGNGTAIIGLRRKSGVTTTALGAGNGATPTLDDVRDALYRLEAANADMSRVVLFMAPRTWNTVSKLKDSQNRYQVAPDPTQSAQRQLFGTRVLVSPQITITETVGGSTDCSYIIAADMSKVVVGRRAELGVLYDPYSKSSTDQVVIQSQVRYDMQVLFAAAVQVITGVRP